MCHNSELKRMNQHDNAEGFARTFYITFIFPHL